MLRSNLPRAVRVLRRRRSWRQADLAAPAGLSRQVVSRIEVGSVRRLPLDAVVMVAEALGASVDLMLRWEGAQLDRLTDAAHAWLAEATADLLVSGAGPCERKSASTTLVTADRGLDAHVVDATLRRRPSGLIRLTP